MVELRSSVSTSSKPSSSIPGKRTSFESALRSAARAFVTEARRAQSVGGVLDLDLTEGFKGLVLSEALEELQAVDEVFILFGKRQVVESRNHQKIFKRALKRAEELLAAPGSADDQTA